MIKRHHQFFMHCMLTMLASVQVYGQAGTSTATINIQASSPVVTTPPKKYFVAVCTLPNCGLAPSAGDRPSKSTGEVTTCEDKKKKCQTVTLDEIPTQYLPESPLKLNAKATSLLEPAVTITSSDENASLSTDHKTIVIKGPGEVTVKVTQQGNDIYAPAKEVVQKFRVDRRYDTCLPPLLPPISDQKPETATPDASAVISLLGNPYPLSFQAASKDKILIYSSKPGPNEPMLADIKKTISELASKGVVEAAPTPSKYSVELAIPHASILGDLATLVNSLNYTDFTAQNVGKNRVHITSSAKLSCEEVTAFYRDLRDLIWRPIPESPIQRVFYFNASDLAGAVGSGGGSPSGGSAGGGSGSPAAGSPGSSVSGGGVAAGSQSGSASSTPGGSAAMNPAATGSSSNQGTGTSSGAAPSTQAGSGQPAASSGGGSGGSTGSGGSGGQQGAAGGTSATVVGSDYLVFSEPNPGDDVVVSERKRILAALDLPRPEMIINVWSSQKSSKKREDVELAKNQLQVLVSGFNDGLQAAINSGWGVLKRRMEDYSYFDPAFARYISQRYVADGELKESEEDDPYFAQKNYQEVAQLLIDYRLVAPLPDDFRRSNGLCTKERYCLGYVNLFRPLKPRMTDLLLTALASSDSVAVFEEAINAMEQRDDTPDPVGPAGEGFERLNNSSCEFQDRALYRKAINDAIQGPNNLVGRPLYLECFRQTVRRLLSDSEQPLALGLIRAAIADFLFQYKLSQQYPHDFSPYDLQQSAQTLNAALAPLIDAFNRDVRTFQSLMIDEFMVRDGQRDSASWFGGESPSFGSNAIITVRTISGTETTVNTTTSNFLDATQQPSISDLLKSIEASATGSAATGSGSGSGGSGNSGGSGGGSSGSGGSGGSNSGGGGSTTNASTHMKDLLQNISPIQAQVISGVLNAVQSSKIQIGPSLNIDVTPRSLSGASSAEIVATIKADTASSPTYFGGPQDSKTADLSRVAQHDTTTRVRVESIKMFEISTLNAELEKSRSRFPLIPPFVEIPYIGTLVGVPLPVAKEYHTSTAVISAIVIPTAADVVAGLRYRNDRLVTSTECRDDGSTAGNCTLKSATSLSDFHSSPLQAFHRRMVQCFAEGGWSEYPGLPPGIGWHRDCGELSFEIVKKAID